MKANLQTDSYQRAKRSLFDDLKVAHADLLQTIGQLEELTSGEVPTKEELMNARWKVSSASLTRRLLWNRILASLSARDKTNGEDKLRRLQEIDIELLRTSSKHIGAWTPDAILKDWGGYCSASHTIRSKMKAAVEAEQDILYPMLDT